MSDPPSTESETAAPPPAVNGPAGNVGDPYGDATVADASVTVPPPGEPVSQAAHLISLIAPFDGTVIQAGAASAGPGNSGSNPGIRMRTDNHIHMTAATPLTTISLGASGGEVNDAAVAGLGIYCGGEMFEHVVQNTTIHHDANDEVIITGTLGETVGEAATYAYEDSLTISSKERKETVTGDWTATITGKQEWDVQGDRIFGISGTTHETKIGLSSEIFIGGKHEMTVGATLEIMVAATLEIHVGMKQEVLVGGKDEVTLGPHDGLWASPKSWVHVNHWELDVDKHEMQDLKDEVSGVKGGKAGLVSKVEALEKLDVGARMVQAEASLNQHNVRMDCIASVMVVK